MSRTDIDAATFADYLRQMCGDGSVEWSYEPMQTSVLLDVADMLDENAKLRKELTGVPRCETCDAMLDCDECQRADESHKERRRLERENAKLRELMARMAEALGIDCEWADPDWCKRPCALEFGCWPEGDHTEIRCPAWAAMHELGVEVEQ